MSDLDERFRTLSTVRPPDLWPDIEHRPPGPMPEPRSPRVATIAVALAVAAAGLTYAAVAFLGPEGVRRRPGESPPAPVTPVVDATVPVKWPGSIAYGEGSVWVSSLAVGGTGAGTIVRIDPETADVVAEIPVPTVPGWETGGGGIEVAGGSVWVAGLAATPDAPGTEGLLVRIDPQANQVDQQIALDGRNGADVAVDSSGVWVTVDDDEQAELVRVDPETGDVTARIPLRAPWARQVVAVDGTIWVHEHRGTFGLSNASTLTRIDPATNEVLTRLPTGHDIFSMTASDGWIWASTYEGDILRIDPRTNRLIETIEGFSSPALAGGEGGIWGSSVRERGVAVVRFDTSTGTVDASVELSNDVNVIDVATAPGAVWVLDYANRAIRIDLG